MIKKKEKTQRQKRNELRQQLHDNIDWDKLVVQQHRPWTYVNILTQYKAGNGKLVTVRQWGVSKICWPDRWDEEEGIDMAVDRATGWAVSAIIVPLEE